MKFRPVHILAAVLALALALALAMPAVAQGIPTTTPGPQAAQVTGTPGSATDDILPIRIIEVNGRNIQPREVLWLEPGRYEFRVQVDLPRGQAFRRSPTDNLRWRTAGAQTRRQAMTIELDLEAGKTYDIRVRYNRKEQEAFPWSTVLWRVSE